MFCLQVTITKRKWKKKENIVWFLEDIQIFLCKSTNKCLTHFSWKLKKQKLFTKVTQPFTVWYSQKNKKHFFISFNINIILYIVVILDTSISKKSVLHKHTV